MPTKDKEGSPDRTGEAQEQGPREQGPLGDGVLEDGVLEDAVLEDGLRENGLRENGLHEKSVGQPSAESVKLLLSEHFGGKRDSKRSFKLIEVEVGGQFRSFQGLAVDVSRSGLLLRIMDPQFARFDASSSFVRYTELVESHFGVGLWIRFRGTMVRVDANVIRVATFGLGDRELILVGCRFDRLLTVDECAQIGIDPSLTASQEVR